MKILFAQGKGGVGKSTLAFLFAITIQKSGKTVGIRDLDPQKSLTAWLKDTKEFTLAAEGEVTIIDTPPRIDDRRVLAAIRAADRIVIPTTPSPADVATVHHSAAIVQENRQPSSKAFVVYNRVKKASTYGKNLEDLSANLPIPPARTVIHERELFKHVLMDGWPALDAAAREEIMNLVIEVQ